MQLMIGARTQPTGLRNDGGWREIYRRGRHAGLIAILCLLTSGCGTGLFGSQGVVYKVTPQTPSPLPPLKLDNKLVLADQQALWGRVVINGRAAKKNEVKVIATASKTLIGGQGNQPPMLPKPNSGKKLRPVEKQYSASVLQDDGLYLLKGLVPGAAYTLHIETGPAFTGTANQLSKYSSPFSSPFKVKMKKGQQMLDLVLEPAVAPPAAK
ncbi:hypothetical protein [Planctomicrobium piriforme]|uniref:Uncharacterized protein n=1 Tax=Planctomicrobium piriforme TaxID=1576369 RepID=A0A1I3BKV9_9PLAN|nr:hypothetical protein [Planctomicrobium piriforme]SFH62925.1 hypothetical protein SAMN05421753_101512 [Planctomicrobium piriforme]